jgi:SAM-dependent methyltransferase
MIREWVDLEGTCILDSGCGLGAYLNAFAPYSNLRFGHDVEHERLVEAIPRATGIVESVGEHLPFADDVFDFVFSNEVIEHVADDAQYAAEMVRVTKPGGRLLIFCPNRSSREWTSVAP